MGEASSSRLVSDGSNVSKGYHNGVNVGSRDEVSAPATWGDLRSAVHSKTWHLVRDLLMRASTRERAVWSPYVHEHILISEVCTALPMLGRAMQSVHFGPVDDALLERLPEGHDDFKLCKRRAVSSRLPGAKDTWKPLVFETSNREAYVIDSPPVFDAYVGLEDVQGDVTRLSNQTLVMAHEFTTLVRVRQEDVGYDDWFERYTFQTFATEDTTVTIRWLGIGDDREPMKPCLMELLPSSWDYRDFEDCEC